MNATQARELRDSKLNNELLAPLLVYIHKKIEEAAKRGLSQITNPFSGYGHSGLNAALESAALLALRSEGYKVTDHPDPDPGYPGSGPYTTIEW